MIPFANNTDHNAIFIRIDGVKMPVDKDKVTEYQRAFHEFTTIAQSLPSDSYICYTDGSEQNTGEKNGQCGSGFVIFKGIKEVKKGQRTLGICDNNFGEISSVYECLKWLKRWRYGKGRDSEEVHIFVDSDYVATLLTEGVKGVKSYKYYRFVQSIRRWTATMPDFTFVLHWIPSHLSHGCQIPGSVIADQLAGQTSRACTATTHKEYSYETHKALLREVASLVGGIERLFST